METSTLMETTAQYYYDYYAFNHSFYYDLYFEELNNEVRHIASLVIFSTVIILSLIGNILVVVMSVFCMRLQSLTSIFILNLALSDLLFTVGLLFIFCGYIWSLSFGDAVCKVGTFILSAGNYSSMVFLLLMTLQHYMAVVQPQSGCKKGRWVTHVLICAWIISVLASLPGVMQIVHLFPELCTYSTITAFLATTFKENVIFVCAFLFMAFCFIRILQSIFKSPPNQRHKVTGLAFILAAVFFICWAPLNIVNFLFVLTYYYEIPSSMQVLKHLQDARYICHLLAFTRCCLNPMIYGLFGVKYRTGCKRLFNGEQLETLQDERLGSL